MEGKKVTPDLGPGAVLLLESFFFQSLNIFGVLLFRHFVDSTVSPETMF